MVILYFIIGFVIGVGFSILKLLLIFKSLNKSLDLDKKTAFITTFIGYIFRIVLAFVILMMLVNINIYAFWAFIIGMTISDLVVRFKLLQNKKRGYDGNY